MQYKLEIYQEFQEVGGICKYYRFKTLEELKERIQNRKSYETVLSVKEFHLVYQHSIFLPICDEMTIYSKREIYHNWVKTPREKIQTAKQKDYKHNFIEDFTHYCLQYETLTKDENQGYIFKVGANYDLRNSDRQAIMKALYEHSKSNRVFNLRLYQYRLLSLEEIVH